MVETLNVGDCIEDRMLRTGIHEEAYETGINIKVRHQHALIGLPTQFEREVAGKGGCSHASLGPHHSNHRALIRRSNFRGSLTGSADRVPQSLYEKRTVADAFHNVVVFRALLYLLQRARLRFTATQDENGNTRSVHFGCSECLKTAAVRKSKIEQNRVDVPFFEAIQSGQQ